MARIVVVFLAASVMLFAGVAVATDADTINDFCVADLTSSLVFNGLACKSVATVTSSDFWFTGLRNASSTNNTLGIGFTPGFANINYPALNHQGLSLARFDYGIAGLVPPHTHPRASEVLMVASGSLYVGFVDTSGTLYSATLTKGDAFLFPRGLVHFQLNVGVGMAVSMSTLNAQNPGVQLMPSALFGSTSAIKDKVLMKGFGISNITLQMIKSGFQPPPMPAPMPINNTVPSPMMKGMHPTPAPANSTSPTMKKGWQPPPPPTNSMVPPMKNGTHPTLASANSTSPPMKKGMHPPPPSNKHV